MPTSIMWKPVVSEGELLTVGLPDLFILQMQAAFPGEWPIRLTAKSIERLEGMAAATQIIGNPYLKLLEHLKQNKRGVEIWPEYGEGAF